MSDNGRSADPNTIPCVICNHTGVSALPQHELSHLVKCAHCGLVRVRDFPSEHVLQGVYDESYYRSPISHVVGYQDYEADRHNIMRTAYRRLRVIADLEPSPGLLLDVGCALGFFLEEAKEHGWKATGIDISPFAVAYVRERTGHDVYCGEISQVGLEPGQFDVVTLWDVIEHMVDPLTELRECYRLLRPGGLLALSTPDIGSLTARLTGSRWMGYKLADEHLYYFSRDTLARLLEKAGFRLVHAGHVGKFVTLRFFVERLTLYAPRLARMIEALLARSKFGDFSVYVNPHDIMYLVARRSDTPS